MRHLIARFFGFLNARPLSPGEQDEIAQMLSPQLRRLFYRQGPQDQRHALEVARRVADTPELVEAALLHDVGKSEVHLGAFGRSFATLWSRTSLPVWGQWRTYLDHAAIGSELLERHGAGPMAIAFTRHHPGPPPPGVPPSSWHALARADDA
jgi:hypothetical protein